MSPSRVEALGLALVAVACVLLTGAASFVSVAAAVATAGLLSGCAGVLLVLTAAKAEGEES